MASDSASLCNAIADSVSASMGGTSGALIELMLRAMAAHCVSIQDTTKSATDDADNGGGNSTVYWGKALQKGVEAMQVKANISHFIFVIFYCLIISLGCAAVLRRCDGWDENNVGRSCSSR